MKKSTVRCYPIKHTHTQTHNKKKTSIRKQNNFKMQIILLYKYFSPRFNKQKKKKGKYI